jgi:predicted porin
MTTKLTPLALAFAAIFATSAQAQSATDLQQAADRAMKAAEQAMKAAADAQRAAEQAQQALAQAQAAAGEAKAKPAAAPTQSTGLSYQSGANSVTLYGLIDVTLTHVDHANAAGDARTSYQPAPWFSGSRWGLTGKHDLGDGLAAIFRLESEFVTNTGEEDAAGILFGRDAWLGMESADLGKFTFGRQNALGRDIAAGYLDPYGQAKASTAEGGGTNTNNFKQLIFYAGSATGTRYDRGMVWKKAFDNGLVAGLGYQFGGVAGSFSTGSTKTAALAFNGGPFNVAGFVNSANVSGLKHDSYSIGGNYTFGMVRANAGYFHYTADQGASNAAGKRKDNAYTVSANLMPGGKMDYQLGYQIMSANNAGITGTGATANVLNAFADTSAITTTATGKRKTVYGSVFYHFDRQTDVYLAADHLTMTDAYRQKSVNGFLTQNELGVGMRFRF